MHVEVYAERNPADPKTVKVTEANLTYVAIDRDGRPRPIVKAPAPAPAPAPACAAMAGPRLQAAR